MSAEGNLFDVKLLSKSKIKYSINAFYPSANPPLDVRPGGPNIGTAEGEAPLKGDTAVIKPSDTTKCQIKVKFLGKKIVIDQDGADYECGFGMNVSASGTYIKKSSRPRF